MAKILIINKNTSQKMPTKKELPSLSGISKRGSIKISMVSAGFLMTFFIIFTSAFYLFQVNDLAVKGYDIRDLENKISELEKENKQMQVHEMELRSMYVIEKSVQSFNLVSPVNVTYLDISNTVAIR
ncbi:MAG: hypothetical protein WCK16_03440 [Candidatus Moraniibacteriota bacterium]